MIYTRKFMFLILVISLFGFCFNAFAQTRCECGHWDPVKISWCEPPQRPVSTAMNCGESICMCNVCQCCPIKLTFTYICNPNNQQCFAKYTWTISGPNGYSLSSPGWPLPIPSGSVSGFIPTVAGLYTVTVTAKCGDIDCCSCTIEINVREIVQCSSASPNPCSCFHPGLPTE